MKNINEDSKSLYNVCHGQRRRRHRFDKNKMRPYIDKGVKLSSNRIEIDPDKVSIDDIQRGTGGIVPPDEVLQNYREAVVKIPIKPRESFPKNNQLPESDLLKVLHYYTSRRLQVQNLGLENHLDETALLAFGVLVNNWADDIVADQTEDMYNEKDVMSDSDTSNEKNGETVSYDSEDDSDSVDNDDDNNNDKINDKINDKNNNKNNGNNNDNNNDSSDSESSSSSSSYESISNSDSE